MKRTSDLAKALALVAAIGAMAWTANSFAKGKPGLGGCPRDIQCPDVYDPVTCANGVTYSNACYAFAACATGCTEGGGGA